MTTCLNCIWMHWITDRNGLRKPWIYCQFLDDGVKLKDALNEELTCEGYVDNMDDGRTENA